MGPEHRLATYGTLSPGQANHHEVAGIAGTWRRGIVRGVRLPSGQGAAAGYPVFHPDPNGPQVDVHLLESQDLPTHWPRLDAFEGESYRRVTVEVIFDGETLLAQIYSAA
jgi:gamma-glutamylcyclotransferase (GGCT)/AIG2-like uncharacterized protein YtfP